MRGMSGYQFVGGTALLTGAASGIGEQLAYQLAERGSNLVLLDRAAGRLDGVVTRICREYPAVTVEPLVVDLADTETVAESAARVVRNHPGLSLLINNAGVALAGQFEQLSWEEFDWVQRINFRAPVRLIHELLPTLLHNPGSHIVNVSSVYGLITPPGQSAYSASKFGLRGFSDCLRQELAGRVGVTTVYPGGIRTRIAESARLADQVDHQEVARGQQTFSRVLSYPPERAAAHIRDGIEKRRSRVLIASTAKIPDVLARIAPTGHEGVLFGNRLVNPRR